ncbi:MAG: exo-alpha-sialidase [Spirochaetes bacterium]|nr:exo-alpha-sialidase [Spirochaetota bacterium]
MKLSEILSVPFYKQLAGIVFTLSLISLIFVLLFRNDKISSAPAGWDKSYIVTPPGIKIKNFRGDYKGNIIAVVYEADSGNIYLSISFDEGKTFLKPVSIASIPSKTDKNPDISISNKGHIAVVWQVITEEDPNIHVYFSISTNMGAEWTKPEKLKSPTGMELIPRALYDGKDRLHIFYNAYNEGSFNLFQVTSEENNFGEPKALVTISEGLRGAFFPALHASGENIYLVWQGKEKVKEALTDDLYFIKSGNYGRTWTSKTLLTRNTSRDSSPFITSYKDVIYLVYQNDETKNWTVKLMRGTDNGNRWDNPVTVSETNADCYSPVAVKTNDNNLFVIWYDSRQTIPGIYSRKLAPGSDKFSGEARLSRIRKDARTPYAVSLGKKAIVIWEEAGRIVAKGTDVYAKPPIIYSSTHPEDKWVKSSRAVIRWSPPEDESGIAGYATFLKKPDDYSEIDIDPTVPNIEGNIRQFITPELEDGISYFYIRAIDGAGNYSRTVKYRLQVSKYPPSMPVISSSTHTDGKPSDMLTADLNWSIEESARIKGFLYSLSKDKVVYPEKFTKNSRIEFKNLNEGRYFFTLVSLDKTNTASQVATYQLIVGKAEKLDPEYYSRIAKGIKRQKPPKQTITPETEIYAIELDIPFDTTKPFNKDSFTAEINTGKIDSKKIAGYSYYIGKKQKEPANTVNINEPGINLSDLENGEYFLSVKALVKSDTRKKPVWTDTVTKRFTINLIKESPVIVFLTDIFERLSDNFAAVVISLAAMLFSIITIGFGAKLPFYTKLLQNKVTRVFRVFL